jgi:Skp family chaperone for outer membrane proteins
MNILRTLPAAALFAAVVSLPVFAQGGARPAATPAPVAKVATPAAKIGLIDVRGFTDEKTGITRLINALDQVVREFKPRQDEIQAIETDITKRTTDLQNMSTSNVVDPAKMSQLSDQLEQLKKDYTRKKEDAVAAFSKRRDAVLAPIEEDVSAALAAFATKRGITLVLNATVLNEALVWKADGVDITAEFIAEYNAKPPGAPASTHP